MSSFSETADAENTASITRYSVYMRAVNETARLCHSLTEMQNMQDSYLFCSEVEQVKYCNMSL